MAFDFNSVRGILICPKTRCDLVFDDGGLVCVSPEVRLRYPVLEDIPRMLVEEAEQLSLERWADVMRRHNRDPQTGCVRI